MADLRAIAEARRNALGLTRAALAARMAPRWGCQPESAKKALRRWINREQGGDMTSDRLAELFTELRLRVEPEAFSATNVDSGYMVATTRSFRTRWCAVDVSCCTRNSERWCQPMAVPRLACDSDRLRKGDEMKTRSEIVAMVWEVDVRDKWAVDAVDDALHERAKALAQRPEKEAEWLLAWALDSVATAWRRLNEACADDVGRADRLRNQMAGGMRFRVPDEFTGVETSRVGERHIRLVDAQETLARVLTLYKAMAVDVVAANDVTHTAK